MFKVSNMLSPSNRSVVIDQFLIRTDDGSYFQSYDTMIAFKDNGGNIYLDIKKWDYSVTTIKYLKAFLSMSMVDIKTSIELGNIKLIDMNRGD